MPYSSLIAQQIEQHLTANNIVYNIQKQVSDAEYVLAVRIKLRSKIQFLQLYIIIRSDNFSTLATIPIVADENHRLAAAEYLTRANYNVRIGNFELSMTDGSIRYKNYIPVANETLTEEMIKSSYVIPAIMFERFGDGLLEVLFDFKTPEEAFLNAPKVPPQP